MTAVTAGSDEVQRLLEDSRPRAARPLDGREWTVTVVLAGVFVALALPMALFLDGGGWPAPLTLLALVAVYAVASTVEIDVGAGYTLPTQIVLVPMLFSLPAGVVPFAVLAGLLLGGLPRIVSGRCHPERALIQFWNAFHSVGPALVFGLAGAADPALSDWPVYLAALGAQFACDLVGSTVREWLALGIRPALQVRTMAWVYLMDTMLAPIGLVAALAADVHTATLLLLAPLFALLELLARERAKRIARESALREVDADLREREASMRRLAAEQAALRRVASAVAAETSQDDVFALVAREMAELLDCPRALVGRFDPRGCEVAGVHGPHQPGLGAVLPVQGDGAIPRLSETGRASRVDDPSAARAGDPAAPHDPGVRNRSAVAAPVWVGGRLWGAVLVSDDEPLPAGIEERVGQFAGLVGVAVANARDHQRLADLGTTDPLTGLPNRRAFQERLTEEVERARRYGRPLALAVFDLDHFKRINDQWGHQVGDRVLVEAARRISDLARKGEMVARVGGEEFAWLLPETDGMGAFGAAERCRRAISSAPFVGIGRVTTSAGVCDLAQAGGAAELFRLADVALYWAKAHGRDATFRYSPDSVRMLSAEEQEARTKRSEALVSIRVLARAIDAKDPATQRHSERVADLAERIAQAAGWPAERATLLREAGLVHDVGKIGVRDAVLLKPGRLTPEEYEEVKQHAELGARIVSDVLSPEQTAWVRGHHERWDGTGYPDGLAGEAIPDGAAILALADAWDVMTAGRSYRPHDTPESALAECEAQAGRQFSPWAVACLRRLHEAGDLGPAGARDGVEDLDSSGLPAGHAGH